MITLNESCRKVFSVTNELCCAIKKMDAFDQAVIIVIPALVIAASIFEIWRA